MTSTFLGKWRFFLTYTASGKYAGYKPNFHSNDLSALVLFGSPREETNIAFILRSDSQLCFLWNDGKYVAGTLPLFPVNTLEEAQYFAFPGHDHRHLPTQFNSVIKVGDDRFITVLNGLYLVGGAIKDPPEFKILQITPTLASLQSKGNGDGLDFGWVDLTGGTLDEVSLIGTDFSHCNLTKFKFLHCVMRRAILNNCTLPGADFSGSGLAGANLNHVDLTDVVANPIPELYINPLQPPSSDNRRTTFVGSRLKQSLIGNDWSMLDLTGATILNLSTPLSSQTEPLWAKYSILTSLNQNNFSDLLLQYAVFDNAVLDSVNLNGSDLTNASFIQASMHGTVLSDATLKNANLTGAQLGALSDLFTLSPSFEKDLNAGPAVDTALRNQFAEHGITLSATTMLNTLALGRVWQLNDEGNKVIYTVRLESDLSQGFKIYKPATAASLVNAYMPDAILTGANLFGITANNIQFYGSKAKIDGSAILEDAKLNGSNLSTVNFTQAQLLGANLSNCQLFNAKFNKANLSPSATGGATDLSDANLQGADFTDAQLYGANLTNAAVAINVPTKANPKQGGVYLFSLPHRADGNTLRQYTEELTDAATLFSLNPGGDPATLRTFVTALNTNDLAPLKVAFLKHKPPINLSANAQIKQEEVGSVWQLVDEARTYTLWTDADEEGKTELYVAPSLTKMRAAFKRSSMTLRWQASAAVETAGQQWLLDNDSENPQNFSTGYVKFILKLNGNVLDVYGTALRILRLGDHNKEQFETETCQITIISATSMNADTVCPNGATLSVNQSRSGKNWDNLWLRAATPPRPPDCVPTDFNWCPPPTKRTKKNDRPQKLLKVST